MKSQLNNESRIGRYIRVSHKDQNTARQEIKNISGERIFIDKISGSIAFNHRPAAIQLMEAVSNKEIDEVRISSIDRLGRDAWNVQIVLNYLTAKSINVKVENLGVESIINGKPNPIFKIITDVLANISEMQRESILEAQREGIAIAKANGKFKGRVKGSSMSESVYLEKHKEIVKYLKQGRLSIREIVKQCGSSLSTVQRVKKIVDSKNDNN